MKNTVKKTVCIILAASLSAALAAVCFAEFKASFSLTGPDSVRAGDTLTVQFKADGNGICGILADITFDTSKLTYSSSSGALADWKVEVTDKKGTLQIWAEENNSFKSPINSKKTVISLSFTVKSGVKTGDKIDIKANISQVSDTENELNGLSASYTATVARPLSDDSSLKSLSVEGYEIKPEFSPSVTEYEIEGDVEFSQNALKISAAANDGEASIDINGARLSVGVNTVRIKVTAENNKNTTVYTVKAKMKQDPNYVPSSDASLSEITVSEGRLSPAFSPDRFDYIVYLPYEAETLTVSGTPADGKAVSKTEGSETLEVGENPITVRCIAEDGSVNEYKITVMRMPAYDTEPDTAEETETDTEPEITETEPVTETDPVTELDITETETETEPVTEPETVLDDTTAVDEDVMPLFKKVPLWIVIAAAVGGIAVGALGTVFVINSIKERK